MNTYVVLLRGINVGGKNKVPMSELRSCLEDLGFCAVSTYIASGNVIFKSNKSPNSIKTLIEEALTKHFSLDSELIRVLVLDHAHLKAVIDDKPKGFGEEAKKYHSDVIFLMDIAGTDALSVFRPLEGVDTIWPGSEVIYSQRLSAERTRSRLSRIVGTKPYKSMTIRTWNTVVKLWELLKIAEAKTETQ